MFYIKLKFRLNKIIKHMKYEILNINIDIWKDIQMNLLETQKEFKGLVCIQILAKLKGIRNETFELKCVNAYISVFTF